MVAQATPPAGHARCRCGHFPAPHMIVVPDTPGKPGGFHMAAEGSCVVCGSSGCAKYSPGS